MNMHRIYALVAGLAVVIVAAGQDADIADGIVEVVQPPLGAAPELLAELDGGDRFPLKPGYRWTYQLDGRDTLFLETHDAGDGTVNLRTYGGSVFWLWNGNQSLQQEESALKYLGYSVDYGGRRFETRRPG